MVTSEHPATGLSVVFDEDVADSTLALIEDAKERLYLVSPFNLHQAKLERALSDAAERGVRMTLVFSGGWGRWGHVGWLRDIGAAVAWVPELHSKIYMNEETALVGSMNLVEASFQRLRESGVRIEKAQHPDAYNTLERYVRELLVADGGHTFSTYTPTPAQYHPNYCIRCRTRISPSLPHCKVCRKRWGRFGREDYEEKYCHGCGKEWTTSKRNPLCPDCKRKAPANPYPLRTTTPAASS